MPSCVVKYCKNCSQKQKKEGGISFHRFPADPVVRNKWVSIIQKHRKDDNWLPSKFCVVCSLHFEQKDVYFTDKGRRLILKNALPSQCLNELAPSPKKSSVVTGGLPIVISAVNNSSLEVDAAPSNSSVFNPVPVTYSDESPIECEMRDSDLESIFDTPLESRLRKELRKHQLLRAVTRRKLKTLQEKVRRLKKRNLSLKCILRKLKEKNDKL